MKFNLWYNPHENKNLPKIKIKSTNKINENEKYVQKTEIYNKNRKAIVDFAMALIGHRTGGQCLVQIMIRWQMFTYAAVVPGRASGYVLGRSAAYENQA